MKLQTDRASPMRATKQAIKAGLAIRITHASDIEDTTTIIYKPARGHCTRAERILICFQKIVSMN